MTEEKVIDEQALKMFNKFRSAYQERGWTQKHLAELIGEGQQQTNSALRGIDNGPRAKRIRAKAREVLEIE